MPEQVSLYLVVPCYNEEEVLPTSASALLERLRSLSVSEDSRILFVDDGSKDNTWSIITQLHSQYPEIIGLRLIQNRGHQAALYAGLMHAMDKCDCAISLDADLQDDLSVMPMFLAQYISGSHIVYGVRKDRSSDSLFKRISAQMFYKAMSLLGANTVYNHADYRLMSNRALQILSSYKEVGLFLRGIAVNLGLSSSYVYYDRKERLAGVTKYSLRKMVNLAADGITSFSVKPLRLISALGILVSFSSLLLFSLPWWFRGLVFVEGLQLLGIGIVGEYIGKILFETKQRPRYTVEEVLE